MLLVFLCVYVCVDRSAAQGLNRQRVYCGRKGYGTLFVGCEGLLLCLCSAEGCVTQLALSSLQLRVDPFWWVWVAVCGRS